MVEKPIIFSTDMVRATLDDRKKHTRRVVKETPSVYNPPNPSLKTFYNTEGKLIKPPYQAGDLLWVREAWQIYDTVPDGYYGGLELGYPLEKIPKQKLRNVCLIYKADGLDDGPWRPAIHMPRWAARIFLEVQDVRVERLQDITEEDVLSEGFRMDSKAIFSKGYKGAFKELWNSLYAKRGYPWYSNPWVWVIEFERVEGGGE